MIEVTRTISLEIKAKSMVVNDTSDLIPKEEAAESIAAFIKHLCGADEVTITGVSEIEEERGEE